MRESFLAKVLMNIAEIESKLMQDSGKMARDLRLVHSEEQLEVEKNPEE